VDTSSSDDADGDSSGEDGIFTIHTINKVMADKMVRIEVGGVRLDVIVDSGATQRPRRGYMEAFNCRPWTPKRVLYPYGNMTIQRPSGSRTRKSRKSYILWDTRYCLKVWLQSWVF
jgi:hypothetical protein